MSQQPNVVYVKRPSNSMGLAGFIVSLVGWLSCGLLCPIGLVLSVLGMRKEPRGFALAGLILGLLGSVWGIVAVFFGGFAILIGCAGIVCGGLAPQVVTKVHIASTAREVAAFQRVHGRIPASMEEINGHVRRSMRDGWDRPLHVLDDGKGGFVITSDGPDGVQGNSDDIEHMSSSQGTTESVTPVGGRRAR